MNEEAKEKLYNQLIEINQVNTKEGRKELITREEFNNLSDKEALKYVFEYRDNETEIVIDGEELIPYIELPDLNMEGQDLSDVILSKFVLAQMQENDGVYTIEKTSKVNLKDTNAVINLSNLQPNKVENEGALNQYSIDFTGSNFKGCDVFGILPDEYAKGGALGKIEKEVEVIGKEEAFDEEYLNRRKEKHLSEEAKKVTDRAYERLLSGRDLKGTRNQDLIDFTDYNLSKLTEEQIKYVIEKEIKIDYPQTKTLIKYFHRNSDKNRILKKELEKGNMEYVKAHFGECDRYSKGIILQKEQEKGNMEYVQAHFGEINYNSRWVIVQEEYKKGNEKFVQEHFKDIDDNSKGIILQKEQEKGHMKYVEEHFGEIDSNSKCIILRKEHEKGNMKYVQKHFRECDSHLKGMILQESDDKIKKQLINEFIRDKTGEELYKELLQDDNKIDLTLVIEMIKAGENVNYIHKPNSEEYIPVLYRATLINDHEKRETILNELIDAGVDLTSAYIYVKNISSDRYSYSELVERQQCLDRRDGELRNLVENRVRQEYEKGNMGFVKEHFKMINRVKFLEQAAKNGDMEFVKEYFEEIYKSEKRELLIQIYKNALRRY